MGGKVAATGTKRNRLHRHRHLGAISRINLTEFVLRQSEIETAPAPRGVLGISSDGDDQRIFFDLKFSIPGFFGVRDFGLGSLI